MIHLYFDKKRVGSFKSFETLIDYLNRQENLKVVDYNCYQPLEKWKFTYHSYKKPSNGSQPSDYIDDLLEAADWLEYYIGDPANFYQVTVTEESDLLGIMRDWCIEYCFAHNFTVLESYSYGKKFHDRLTSPHPLHIAGERHKESHYGFIYSLY